MAYAMLNLSVAGGDQEALAQRDIVEKHMTKEQIDEAQRLSRGGTFARMWNGMGDFDY